MELPKVDLYKPFEADKVGPPPVALRVVVTPTSHSLVEGPAASSRRAETYVLLSVLPDELRNRVVTAVQAAISGMST